jgi:hypothetical protein
VIAPRPRRPAPGRAGSAAIPRCRDHQRAARRMRRRGRSRAGPAAWFVSGAEHEERRTQRRVYEAPAAACRACALKAQCTTLQRGRRVGRSFDEAALDRVRGYRATEPNAKAMRKRKVWVEPLFAAAKDWHRLRRSRLRGLPKANGEALLIAAGQNLKRLLTRFGRVRRPWPTPAPAPTDCGSHAPRSRADGRGNALSCDLTPSSTGCLVSETDVSEFSIHPSLPHGRFWGRHGAESCRRWCEDVLEPIVLA